MNTLSTYLYLVFLSTLPAWCFRSCLLVHSGLVSEISSEISLDLLSSLVLAPVAPVFTPFFILLHTLFSKLFLWWPCWRWCLWWCRWWWWWCRWVSHEFEFSVTIFINKVTKPNNFLEAHFPFLINHMSNVYFLMWDYELNVLEEMILSVVRCSLEQLSIRFSSKGHAILA